MDKLSFRSKRQDSGSDLIMEEGHPTHKPIYNNLNNNNNNKEEVGSPFHMFSVDVRSLALFRVVTGLVVMLDVLARSRSLFAHYANLGVWPIVEAINNINAHSFSFHFANGNISLSYSTHPFNLKLQYIKNDSFHLFVFPSF